jgi:diadenylate cyclase
VLEGLLYLFSRRPPTQVLRDALDIVIVAYVVYRALLVLRGTRAQQMSVGVLVIAGVYVAARWIGLVTLVNLMDVVLSSFVLILVVVFQNDIRRGLMRVGDRAWLGTLSSANETKVIDEVVAAATELARHRMGALIAFEQNATLDEFVVGHGIPLDSAVTRELLVTIFQPESVNKLHDGAVILRALRISSAGVFFPMPEARNLDPSLGSRHRAALGVTDETDAVVVVVSEERGSITVCYRGNMIQHLDGQKLRGVLLDLMGYKQPARRRTGEPAARPDARREGGQPPASSPAPSPAARQSAPPGSLASPGSTASPGQPAAAQVATALVRPLPRSSDPPVSQRAPAAPTPLKPSPIGREEGG